MADFQTVVNVYPARGIPGAYASVNPIVSTALGRIAGEDIPVGGFCWDDTSNEGQVKKTGTGKPLGFVVLERNYPIVNLSTAQNYVPQGFNVPVQVEGDFYVAVSAAVTKGQKVFVNNTTGVITGAAADLPCLNEPTRHNGIPIMRDECKMDGNCTPIQMQTQNSIEAIKKTLVPFEINQMGSMTGGAADMGTMNMFPDVPDAYWAACDISKLAMNDVVVGYPDRMFRPARDISRAEFATMLVKGFNKEDCGCGCTASFKDVPSSHWANSMIAKAVNENLMKGYPNNLFKPENPVTRIEAICAMSKALNCNLDECQAKNILSKYCDGNKVPEWAQVPIAKALDQGILKNTQNPNMIEPFKEATGLIDSKDTAKDNGVLINELAGIPETIYVNGILVYIDHIFTNVSPESVTRYETVSINYAGNMADHMPQYGDYVI